jgi:magnesium transporter
MRAHEVCGQGFAKTHPTDAARVVEQYSAHEAAAFLEELPAATAASVLERMSPVAGASCLANMDLQPGAAVTGALSPAVAVALLRRLTQAQRGPLVSALPDDRKDRFHLLLSYDETTVGSITDPGVLALPVDLSVGQALRQLRRYPTTTHHHVYVVDRAHRLVGLLHIRDLVSARSQRTLAGIMQPADATLAAMSRLTSAASHPAWRHMDTLPVIDDAGMLLGIVRHRQFRHLDAMGGSGDITGTILSLGELYWLWLSTLFPVAPNEPTHENREPRLLEGGEHDG